MISPNLGALLPALPAGLILLGAVKLVLADCVLKKRGDTMMAGIALFFTAAAFVAQALVFPHTPQQAFSGALSFDGFGALISQAVLIVLALTVLMSPRYFARMRAEGREHYALLFISALGMMLLPAARELVSLIVCIELISIPLYVLAGFNRDLEYSREAALKYFLLGAFATAFMAYGAAFLYGATGTLHLQGMGDAILTGENDGTAMLVFGLLLIGFAFKVALVPFHAWVPDVYQGSPSPITGFMAAGVKLALFAALIRLLGESFLLVQLQWRAPVYVLCILTMTLGNLLALHQQSLKRLLAYSSIAHAGYITIALLMPYRDAQAAVLFYLIAYGAAVVGAFALISGWAGEGRDDVFLDELGGMAQKQPLAAFCMLVFLLSLIGVPLTAGFLGKLMIFTSAYQAGYVPLLLLAIANSIISVYYYLRVAQAMYILPQPAESRGVRPAVATGAVFLVVAGICAVAVIWLGTAPGFLLQLAKLYGF
jgi:NADH-quinone oxidoreductase subunit N